jgi:hypothetical protein
MVMSGPTSLQILLSGSRSRGDIFLRLSREENNLRGRGVRLKGGDTMVPFPDRRLMRGGSGGGAEMSFLIRDGKCLS